MKKQTYNNIKKIIKIICWIVLLMDAYIFAVLVYLEHNHIYSDFLAPFFLYGIYLNFAEYALILIECVLYACEHHGLIIVDIEEKQK